MEKSSETIQEGMNHMDMFSLLNPLFSKVLKSKIQK